MLLRTLASMLAATCCLSAQAATPASGTLTIDSDPVEYAGDGPYVNFNQANYLGLVDDSVQYMCMSPVLECDEFKLTVDLPEELIEVYPTAVIRMTFPFDDPTGSGNEDYDFFVLDANGAIINRGETAANPEKIAILAASGVTEYTIVGIPYFAINSNYAAKIELDLGEPVESRATFIRPDAATAEFSAAGGALDLGLLLIALGSLVVRRKTTR